MSRFASNNSHHECGFTILELLVSLVLTSLVMIIVISGVTQLRNTYFADIKRTEMNGNLRSAMDIVSMNIRQTGENLLAVFPAALLESGDPEESSTLSLRRSPIIEALTLCADSPAGTTRLYVSSASVWNADCLATNVGPVYTIFTDEVVNFSENPRVYIFNKTLNQGEFLEYNGSGIDEGEYYLTVSGTSLPYTHLDTHIYIIEEYRFSHNPDTNRLELSVNDDGEVRPVAFNVTNFQASFLMEDGTEVTSFDQSGASDWKDIHAIKLSLSGRGVYRTQEILSTISAQFFPRNVLSYEGG